MILTVTGDMRSMGEESGVTPATPTTPLVPSLGPSTNKLKIITSTINTLIAITRAETSTEAAACNEQLRAPIILV